jgi:hypothetical protein
MKGCSIWDVCILNVTARYKKPEWWAAPLSSAERSAASSCTRLHSLPGHQKALQILILIEEPLPDDTKAEQRL